MWRTIASEFARSKSAVAGLALIVVIFAVSAFAVFSLPGSTASQWANPGTWTSYPKAAPPTWVNALGVDAPQTVGLTLNNWTSSSFDAPKTYVYAASTTLDWGHTVTPSGFLFIPQFVGSAYEVSLTWTKPDGQEVQMVVASPTSGTNYDLTSLQIKQYILQFVQSQTGSFLSSVTPQQELSGLFRTDGSQILASPVLKGSYKLDVQVTSSAPLTPSPRATLTLVGDSYGTMGTDNFGRPIELGMLAGLPSALELGMLTSVVSVVVGVLFGGFSGFLGGRKDAVMQWLFLVVLAVPALPFLIALSYSVPLNLLTEATFIAALSWPFYAIIARSASLSIRSQAYVEADLAMGVSSLRTFSSHFIPRLTPFAVAYTALGVPGGIILGQILSFLGVQPPNIITWGQLLNDASTYQAELYGWWWWVLFPGVMIVVASIPFVLVGFSIDRIVSPKVSAK